MSQTINRNGLVAFIDGVHHTGDDLCIDDNILTEARKAPVVVFRKVFDKEYLRKIRKTVINFDFSQHNYQRDSSGNLVNFSRTDDLMSRDKAPRYSICYNYYTSDRTTPNIVNDILRTTINIGNILCGRTPNDRMRKVDNERYAAATFYYYPPGGMLGTHHFKGDPNTYQDQFDEIVVVFSEYGKDFKEGGMYVAPRHRLSETYSQDDHGEQMFLEEFLGIGDVVALTIRDVHHIVSPIDPKNRTIDPSTGRFLMLAHYLNDDHLNNVIKKY